MTATRLLLVIAGLLLAITVGHSFAALTEASHEPAFETAISYAYDAPRTPTTRATNTRIDATRGERLSTVGAQSSASQVAGSSAAKGARRGPGRFADETGSFDPAELAKGVMGRK